MTLALQLDSRPAQSSDVTTLAELYRASEEHIEGERGAELHTLFHGRIGDLRASFDDDLDAPDRHVVVGSVDGVVMGYAVLSILEPQQGVRLAEVSELFVLPEARGVGVGAAMLRDVESIASERSCDGITARSLPGDRSTKNFFESLGLVARSIEVYRDLR